MTIESVLQFLVPYDWLQWVFLGSIVASALLNIFFVTTTANVNTWQDNWKRAASGKEGGDFDTEHGSVHDISEAVASPSERLAESMPGILLIIGLLGTFIGLGVALNEAAKVVSANEGIGALGATMEGLGTKFKTSTWGIIAFLLFKVWMARADFDGRRLRWCADKMKEQLNHRRKNQSDRELAITNAIVKEIRASGTLIAKTISEKASDDRKILDESLTISKESHGYLINISKDVNEQKGEMVKFLKASADNLDAIKNSATDMGNAAGRVGESATQLSGVLEQLKIDLSGSIAEMNSSVKENLESVSKVMTTAGNGVAESAKQLNASVEGFETKVTTVLTGLKSDLSASVQEMSAQMEGSAKKIETAVGAIPNAVEKTMKSVEESLMGATDNLQISIDNMSGELKSAAVEIKTEVGKLPGSVGDTMSKLQTAFALNLDKIDKSLTSATGEIIAAVASVPQAMQDVQDTIKSSVAIQTRANGRFDSTSAELRNTVAEMQHFVQSLGGDIKAGLKSISDTGLRIADLEGHFTSLASNSEENANQLKKLVESIQKVESAIRPYVGPVSRAIERIELDRQQLNAIQMEIKNASSNRDAVLNVIGSAALNKLDRVSEAVGEVSAAMAELQKVLLMRNEASQALSTLESVATVAGSSLSGV